MERAQVLPRLSRETYIYTVSDTFRSSPGDSGRDRPEVIRARTPSMQRKLLMRVPKHAGTASVDVVLKFVSC